MEKQRKLVALVERRRGRVVADLLDLREYLVEVLRLQVCEKHLQVVIQSGAANFVKIGPSGRIAITSWLLMEGVRGDNRRW